MNKIIELGNLVKDPTIEITKTGIPVCKFTIAVRRKYQNQAGEYEADFIPVVVWRNQAESCHTYLRKGNKVAVYGSLQVRNYEDKEGNKRTIAEIIAEEVEFLTPKNTEQENKEKQEDIVTLEPAESSDLPF